MSQLVVSGALCKCSFGMAPCPLEVIPIAMTMGTAPPAGNIQAAIPFADIKPFVMCKSIKNPLVAAATTAALGKLTPAACIPATIAWAPGSPTVLLKGMPALNKSSVAKCSFGGIVTISFPGEVTINVP